MEKIHYIYGLYSTRKLNPDGTPKVKYVGRSSNPNTRLKQHINSIGKIDNILYQWMIHELAKGFEIKFIILDQCPYSEINEREKYWISSIGRHKKLLNTSLNDRNSVSQLTHDIKQLHAALYESNKRINELTGIKQSTGLIGELEKLVKLKDINKKQAEKIFILENYIKYDLQQPLPYEENKRRKKRKPKTDI